MGSSRRLKRPGTQEQSIARNKMLVTIARNGDTKDADQCSTVLCTVYIHSHAIPMSKRLKHPYALNLLRKSETISPPRVGCRATTVRLVETDTIVEPLWLAHLIEQHLRALAPVNRRVTASSTCRPWQPQLRKCGGTVDPGHVHPISCPPVVVFPLAHQVLA